MTCRKHPRATAMNARLALEVFMSTTRQIEEIKEIHVFASKKLDEIHEEAERKLSQGVARTKQDRFSELRELDNMALENMVKLQLLRNTARNHMIRDRV